MKKIEGFSGRFADRLSPLVTMELMLSIPGEDSDPDWMEVQGTWLTAGGDGFAMENHASLRSTNH